MSIQPEPAAAQPFETIRLYQFPPSGNSHKVRLMLSLLALPHDTVNVAGGERQHKSPEFLARNPFGQVPVLTDGAVTLRDSQGILAYLGLAHGKGTWWPDTAPEMADVVAWLSTAANEVSHGPNLLRLHYKFGRVIDVAAAEAVTTQVLEILESRFHANDWLVGPRPTVADVAVYPYIALAPEARIDLAPYAQVRGWISRVQALPGYVGMPGMWPAATPAATVH